MKLPPNDLTDPPDDPQPLPTLEEVSQRLDRLWAAQPPSASGELPPTLGEQVGNYLLLSLLGRGAFGVVYLAEDLELNRQVALKVPRPEVLVDQDRLARFQSEAKAAAALDHPLIIPIYEARLNGPTPYLASAVCHGPDLGRWLSKQTVPVAPQLAAKFIAQLASAVQHAHQSGVVHRDLKPGNVLLEQRPAPIDPNLLSSYEPRLTDFGLAKLIEAGRQDTRSSMLVGTPLYMAPEQLDSGERSSSETTDIYALGVLLFELLTLKVPFEGDSYVEVLDQVRNAPPQKLRLLNPQIPQDLETICNKCLEKEPHLRYPSAEALQLDLQHYLHGEPICASAPSLWEQFNRWSRQPRRLSAAVSASMVINACFLLWILFGYGGLRLNPALSGMSLAEVNSLGMQGLGIVVGVHLPAIVLAWLSRRGNVWIVAAAAINSVVLFLLPLLAALDIIPVFKAQYEGNRYFQWSNNSVVVTGGMVQMALFACALRSVLYHRYQSRVPRR